MNHEQKLKRTVACEHELLAPTSYSHLFRLVPYMVRYNLPLSIAFGKHLTERKHTPNLQSVGKEILTHKLIVNGYPPQV